MLSSLSAQLQERLKSLDRTQLTIGTAISAIVFALVGTGVYFSPHLTLQSMKNATINRNAGALAAEIDFPALRSSIKENIKAQLLKQIAASGDPSSTKVTPELADKTIAPMVDKIVSPEGLEDLMMDKIPDAKIDLSNLERDMEKSDIQMGYESFDRFVVRIRDKTDRQDPTKEVTLVLTRKGLFWKLSSINIAKV